MTFPEFDQFFDNFVSACRKMRDIKGKEYANSEDRFANFNRLSEQLGITNQQIGMVYLTKHLDSIRQYLRTGKIHSDERIRGRYIDAVTYLILMAGMAEEVLGTKAKGVFKLGDSVKYVGEDKPDWLLSNGSIGKVTSDSNETRELIKIHFNGGQDLLILNTNLIHVTNV